jgi:hypothetical protein
VLSAFVITYREFEFELPAASYCTLTPEPKCDCQVIPPRQDAPPTYSRTGSLGF